MAEKCKVCGGDIDITATIIGCKACGTVWGRVNGAWVEDTTCCDDGTGIEPATGNSAEPLECYVNERCALRSRLAAVVEAGEELVYLVEHVYGDIGIEWEGRRRRVLAAWKKVRGA